MKVDTELSSDTQTREEPDAILKRAIEYYSQSRYEEAAEEFSQFIDQEPSHYLAHYRLGNCRHQQGDLQAAIEAYERAIELNSEYPESYNDLGLALQQLDRIDDSLNALKKALELSPQFMVAHMNVGLTLAKRGDLVGAIEAYKRAIDLNPDFIQTHTNIGNAYRSAGKLDLARQHLDKAIELAPKDASTYFNRAQLAKAESDIELAIKLLIQSLTIDITNINATASLTELVDRCHPDLKIEVNEQGYMTAYGLTDFGILQQRTGFEENAVATFFEAFRLKDVRALNEAASALRSKENGSQLDRLHNERPLSLFSAAYGNVALRVKMGDGLIPSFKPLPHRPWYLRKPSRDYLYCPNYRFVYAPIPKVACTSFKMLIYDLIREVVSDLPIIDVAKEHRVFHMYVRWTFGLVRYSEQEGLAIMRSPEVFKFTVVRNPFDRLASAYLDKFVRNRHDVEQWEHTRPVLEKQFGESVDPGTHKLTFRQFLHHLSYTDDEILDPHWAPMRSRVDPKEMDFIGRVETLKDDFETIRNRLNLPKPLPHLHSSPRNRTDLSGNYSDASPDDLLALPTLPSMRQMYDDRLEELVRERYITDFSSFGYPDSLRI